MTAPEIMVISLAALISAGILYATYLIGLSVGYRKAVRYERTRWYEWLEHHPIPGADSWTGKVDPQVDRQSDL